MIAFFASGSLRLGMGHLVRSVKLFHLHQNLSSSSDAVCVAQTHFEHNFFTANNCEAVFLNELDSSRLDYVLVDHKGQLPATLEQLVVEGIRLIAIDSTDSWVESCAAVIYPNFYFDPSKSERLKNIVLPKYYWGRTMLIPSVTEKGMLDNELFETRNILINFGGSDPRCLTRQILTELKYTGLLSQITVLIGPLFEDDVTDLKSLFSEVQFVGPLPATEQIVKTSSVFITAFGTTINEAEIFGIPSLIISNRPEDIEDFNLVVENSNNPERWDFLCDMANDYSSLKGKLDRLLGMKTTQVESVSCDNDWQRCFEELGLT